MKKIEKTLEGIIEQSIDALDYCFILFLALVQRHLIFIAPVFGSHSLVLVVFEKAKRLNVFK